MLSSTFDVCLFSALFLCNSLYPPGVSTTSITDLDIEFDGVVVLKDEPALFSPDSSPPPKSKTGRKKKMSSGKAKMSSNLRGWRGMQMKSSCASDLVSPDEASQRHQRSPSGSSPFSFSSLLLLRKMCPGLHPTTSTTLTNSMIFVENYYLETKNKTV